MRSARAAVLETPFRWFIAGYGVQDYARMDREKLEKESTAAEGVSVPFSELSDHDLIEATRSGDEAAFAEIVSRYKGPLVNFIYRMLGDYDESVDLTQEAFVRVYFAIERYHSEYAFSTYIYRIASNLAISEIRKRKRRKLLSLTGLFQAERESEEVYQPPDTAAGPEDSTVSAELRETIDRAIDSLPDKYKAPIILREIEEMSYEQVAEVLGLGLGTTKSRISRARGILRQKLEGYLSE